MVFLPMGKKEPLHSIHSGSKVAHYVQVVQKLNFITNKNKSKNQVGKSNSHILLSISFV
jgi:hypothetical protein